MLKEVSSGTLWAAWALTSLIAALAGPFGTFAAKSFVWRLSYWAGVIALAIIIAILLRTLWRHLLHSRPEWQEDLVVAISFSVVFGSIVVLVNKRIGGADVPPALGFGSVIGCVFAIAVGTIVMRRALHDRGAVEPKTVEPKPVERDRLFARITAKANTRLSRISSDNHHIRIVTSDGQEHRILMRFSDAVLEANIEPGICIHRSHWVARASVRGRKKVSGRDVVQLNCGVELPVGPKYRSNLDFAKEINA